jgi:copper homeostasis protein
MKIEIVVYNIESAIQAQNGGADRIELCDNPAEGGTTPSYGAIELLSKVLTIEVYVMIRPRGGDFCYSDTEFISMQRDIGICKQLKVAGVVFGILTPEGKIDTARCNNLIELARPMKVTCHRAFDMTKDPFEALEDCVSIGFDRILTSGQQPKAHEGIQLIQKLIQQSAGRISIMLGSGVNEETVSEIVTKTGATEIHFSAATTRKSEMTFRNQRIAGMGSEKESEFKIRTVDPELVKKIRALAEKCR